MAIENPYSSPETSPQLTANAHVWEGRKFTVEASNQAKHLWLLGTVLVSIDDGEPFTSTQIKWKEDFTFDFEHNGRLITGRFTQVNAAIHSMEYRLMIDGVEIAHDKTVVENWLTAFIVGILVGMAGPLILFGAGWYVYSFFK